jgi:hypothetical protein
MRYDMKQQRSSGLPPQERQRTVLATQWEDRQQ